MAHDHGNRQCGGERVEVVEFPAAGARDHRLPVGLVFGVFGLREPVDDVRQEVEHLDGAVGRVETGLADGLEEVLLPGGGSGGGLKHADESSQRWVGVGSNVAERRRYYKASKPFCQGLAYNLLIKPRVRRQCFYALVAFFDLLLLLLPLSRWRSCA